MKHKANDGLALEAGKMAVIFLSASVLANAQMMTGGAGPSVLSRGGNAAGMRGSEAADLTFYAGASGHYDSGIYTPATDGSLEATSSPGYGLSWGAYGLHSWGRRTTLGIDYRGDYLHHTRASSMNGSNQALGVELRHVFNRRWEIVGRETAGTTTRPFGGFTAPSYVTPDTGSVPTTEIYNSRVYYTQTSAYATYTRSSRSIFTVGGGGFFTYRTNEALVNTNSGYALGSWQYRVSRNNAVGTQYYYQKLSYPRAFGASDVNTIGATFQRVLGRYSNFYLLAGMSRAETLGSENYQLSPEISAILGVPTGVRILYRIDYIPTVNASLTYRKRFWGYNAGYNHGIGAGNGVYLTSVHDEGSIGASYSGFRRLAFGTNVSYRRMSSLWQTAEPFQYFTAGGGLSYAFGNGLNLVGQVDWRRMLAGTAINNQRGVVATLGISYSSRTIPLSLW